MSEKAFQIRAMAGLLLQMALVFFSGTTLLNAQVPVGRFQADKIKLGEPVRYTLVYRHNPSEEVIFPDSTFAFAPFEYLSHAYFPTVTSEGVSMDSAVYLLSLFELDSFPSLAIPVIIKENGEERWVEPAPDQIELSHVIEQMPDSVSLRANTDLAPIRKRINYPMLSILGGIMLVLAILGFIFFGKPIRKRFRLARMRHTYQRFIQQYDGLIYPSVQEKTIPQALALWKKYTGNLAELPLDTYTTKEMRAILGNEALYHDLRAIDVGIYAGRVDAQMQQHLAALKDFTHELYTKQVEAIKNE